MILILFISIFFLFAESDSTEVISKTNYFKNLDLKISLDPREILPRDPAQKYAGIYSNINSVSIDSIKAIAKSYIPTSPKINDIIIIKTTKGTIKLKYYPDTVKEHCYNFKKLANSGFYDMTFFHRVIRNFMIQGGDILSRDSDRGNDGLGDPGWTIKGEFSNLKHKRGILSMARGSGVNSAGSQFFICHKDAPWLDGKYTIFGEVIENIHVIDHIADSPTDYTVAKSSCYAKIPDGENLNYWVEVEDPKTRHKLYSKVPIGKKKINYKQELMNDLRSDNPSAPIIIKSIRVIDGTGDNK
jgi:cyclophilin family peptidyl-prolyl cis-trans isomerase